MSPPMRKPTPAELKVARQKKIVIVGSVILVILLAVLGPRTYRQLHPSRESTIPPSMRGVASAATDSAGATATQSTPTQAGQLADTDVVTVQPGSGQLVSFGLFKSKDPFVQQLASATPAAATTPSTAPTAVSPQPAASKQTVTIPSVVATTPTVTAPTPTVSTPPPPATTVAAPPPTTTSTPAPTPPPAQTTPAASPTSAAISTNGHCEVVPVKGVFPNGDEVFRLVSIAGDGASVKIGIAGGSYASGGSTVTLKRGTPLTLVNTADGVRYRLSLLTSCPATTGTSSKPKPAPTTTPPPTTATETAPSSTVTTPAPTTTTSTTPTSTTP